MSIYAFLFLILVAAAVFVIAKGYNGMRRHAEGVKESFSNISVVTRKQTALVNQLITVVGNYAESEKLIMLKLSNDSVQAVQTANATSSVVMAEIGRMAQRFPELRSNQQYNRLMDSINACERDVETSRVRYNDRAREYNTLCSSLPAVLYAQAVGFGKAEYFSMEAQETDAAVQRPMITEDSERLNALLGTAGRRAIGAARTLQQQGRDWVQKETPQLADVTQATTPVTNDRVAGSDSPKG